MRGAGSRSAPRAPRFGGRGGRRLRPPAARQPGRVRHRHLAHARRAPARPGGGRRHCARRKSPRPQGGESGRCKRIPHRRVRTLASQLVAPLDVTYGAYRATCSCCKSFHNTFDSVAPKARYDDQVRRIVLGRLLRDAMGSGRTIAPLRREFLLDLSIGFASDVLRDEARRPDMAAHRRMVLAGPSGTLRVDELHLGRHTLLATGPLRDTPVAFASIDKDDQDHMRRFLKALKTWGLAPRVVATDGSNFPDYPAFRGGLR